MTFLITTQIQLVTQKGITSPQPFYKMRSNLFQMTKFKLLPKMKQFHPPKTHHRTSTLHS